MSALDCRRLRLTAFFEMPNLEMQLAQSQYLAVPQRESLTFVSCGWGSTLNLLCQFLEPLVR